MDEKKIRETIREHYGSVAGQDGSCCGAHNPCCGPEAKLETSAQTVGETIGYSQEEMASVPEGSNLGLGCGNPLVLASLKKGQTVLDLGAGAGFDCFLAAKSVGDSGHVIGVDMTSAMVEKARENARKRGYENVEFRLGEIENLPVADSYADLVISNCVINLSLNKARVFEEAFRVLKPGGNLMLSDIVLLTELPKQIKESSEAYAGCISGALLRDKYLEIIREAGFTDIRVLSERSFGTDVLVNDPLAQSIKVELDISDSQLEKLSRGILSISISALKPE